MSILLEEITAGPLAAELAPFVSIHDYRAIANRLNQADIPTPGSIMVNKFAIWCAETGMRAAIADQAAQELSPLRSIALTLLDLLQGNLTPPSLDLSITQNTEMLHAWVLAGILTVEQEQQLIDLSQTYISRANQIGLVVDANSVAEALGYVASPGIINTNDDYLVFVINGALKSYMAQYNAATPEEGLTAARNAYNNSNPIIPEPIIEPVPVPIVDPVPEPIVEPVPEPIVDPVPVPIVDQIPNPIPEA